MLTGKTALITGGSRGLGRAIALSFAKNHARVAFCYAGNQQAAEETLSELRGLGAQAMAVRCDVSDDGQAQEALRQVKEALGPVDILVNNAGITRDGLALRMSARDFDDVVRTDLNGPFYMIRAAMPDMVRRRWGRIINITSVAGLMGNAGQANYASAKAGLVGLTKTIARELAPRSVTVNAVAPGFIETDMTAAMPAAALEAGLKSVPLKRMGKPEEIAAACLFLAGEQAGYITGQVLQVDGGLYM